jgi:hypothetical protein
MKIDLQKSESGVAVLIILFMISFLLIFVTANANALFGLKREIKLVDQQQKAHWDKENAAAKTNRVQKQIAPEVKP